MSTASEGRSPGGFEPPTPGTRAGDPPATAPYAEAVSPWTTFDPTVVTPGFAPLRTEPPPRLFATWWLRYLLFLTQIVGIIAVLLTEYAEGPGGLLEQPVVVAPYALAGLLLVWWSAFAMLDAGRLVPGTRYQATSRASVSTLLWFLAFAAPFAAVRTIDWAQDRFDETATGSADSSGDGLVIAVTAVAVLVCFLLVWAPFRYHVRQGQRIGAAPRVMQAWFWTPLLAAVGVLAIDALGLHDMLAEDGMTDLDRTIEVAVVFGVPAMVMTLATWRATTVFDEVIDIRWRRWKHEWEQTLAAMSAQPPPPPEPPL